MLSRMMTFRFENGEYVEFNDEKFGRGKGNIVGYCKGTDEYVIYPKISHDYDDYPFVCILVKSNNLISTPF